MRIKAKKYRLITYILSLFMLCSVVGIGQTSLVKAEETTENSTEAETNRKVVRVGYTEVPMYQEGASDGAMKSGYYYDYLQKVAAYTGWEYEYVYGSRQEIYEKLRTGEIDMAAGMGYNKERGRIFGYSDYPVGAETFCLFAVGRNVDTYSSAYAVAGKKIGVFGETARGVVDEWLQEKDITAEVIVYETIEERDEDLNTGKIDYSVEEISYYDNDSNCANLGVVGKREKFIVVTKSRTDILSELNTALTEINRNEPFFEEELSSYYSKENSAVSRISPKERDWLNDHGMIRVGYLTNYLPFCDMDENGKATGVMVDILDGITSNLGISSAVVKYQAYENGHDMIAALISGEVDMIFPMAQYLWNAEQEGVILSNNVISTNMVLVYSGRYDESTRKTVAINANSMLQKQYVEHNMPDATFVECESIEECLDKVLSGDAGSTVINSLRVNDILSKEKYKRMTSVILPEESNRCFAFTKDNIPLMTLINRGLVTLPRNYALTASYEYTKQKEYSFRDFIKDHMVAVLFVSFVCFFLIATGFAIAIIKSRKESLLKKVLREDNLTKLQNRLAYEEELHRHMHSDYEQDQVYITADVNGLKKVNDNLGHVAGDELIRGVASCLKKTFPDEERLYRIGGDEFTIILNMPKEEAEKKLTELRECVYSWQGVKVKRLSISIGVAYRCDNTEESVRELIRMADLKMYDDKRRFYDSEGADRRGAGRRASDRVDSKKENND